MCTVPKEIRKVYSFTISKIVFNFMRRVNIIPQLRWYLPLFLDVLMELITIFLTKGYSVRTNRLFKKEQCTVNSYLLYIMVRI